jgi:hypothetical protein
MMYKWQTQDSLIDYFDSPDGIGVKAQTKKQGMPPFYRLYVSSVKEAQYSHP